MKGNSLKLLSPNVMVVIEGRTTVLRPISEKEINDRYVSWVNDNDVIQFLDNVRHKKQSIEDVVDYINLVRSKPGCEVFAILTKNDQIHIGNVGVTLFNPNNQGYAGYGIMIGDPKARILGLGGEATVMIIEYLFRDPSIRRIQGNVYSDNDKSWKTLETLGFKKEGVLRKHVVLSSGKICDLYMYGLLREEWLEHRMKVMSLINSIKIQDYNG